MRHPEPGAVEQDPRDIRDALFGAVRDVLAAWGGDPAAIVADSLTTQRNTLLPVDEGGEPLREAVSWLDRRSAEAAAEDWAPLRYALKLLGEGPMISRLLAKSLARQWRQREAAMLARARWVAPLEAWLHQQLTGRMALAPGGLAGAITADMAARDWSGQALLHKLLGFERRWLPEVVEAGQLVGHVTPGAARATGLPEGLPFYACGCDKQAEALGAGVRAGTPGIASVSLGTASTIAVPFPRSKQSASYRWITFISCEPGSWQLEYMVFRGFWTVRWFARNFAKDLENQAASKWDGRPVEALLCDEAATLPAGSDGVLTWPRWSPSLQEPAETGTVVGLLETHSRPHVFRSLLEGIAFDLRRGRAVLESATGAPIRELRVGGGGSRSDLVVRILADVLGLPVVRPASEELSARGAAMLAAAGGGVHPSLDAAVAAMLPAAPRIEPEAAAAQTYERIYRTAWLPGLEALPKLGAPLRRQGTL